tara:strand:+ start:44 stop:1018 length:975 start_codon:yes stop_codon:yes gene_type:complete
MFDLPSLAALSLDDIDAEKRKQRVQDGGVRTEDDKAKKGRTDGKFAVAHRCWFENRENLPRKERASDLSPLYGLMRACVEAVSKVHEDKRSEFENLETWVIEATDKIALTAILNNYSLTLQALLEFDQYSKKKSEQEKTEGWAKQLELLSKSVLHYWKSYVEFSPHIQVFRAFYQKLFAIYNALYQLEDTDKSETQLRLEKQLESQAASSASASATQAQQQRSDASSSVRPSTAAKDKTQLNRQKLAATARKLAEMADSRLRRNWMEERKNAERKEIKNLEKQATDTLALLAVLKRDEAAFSLLEFANAEEEEAARILFGFEEC